MRLIILFTFCISFLFAKTEVTLKLKWKNQFQFAGYYMAKEKGFYSTNGLNVKIDEIGVSSPLNSVLSHDLVFGVSDSALIYNKMSGSPVTALIASFQTSPLALISIKDRGINSPLDLKDSIIEVPSYSEANSSIYAMLKSFDVQFSEKFPTFKLDDLINNKTNAISGYISNEPYKLFKEGYESVAFNPKDYGYDFYGDILFTSDKTLEKYPATVNSFTEASILGWKYAFENIDETVELILNKYNTQNKTKDELLFEAKVLFDLAGDMDRFGELNLNKVKNIASIYSILLPNKYDLEQLDKFIYQKNVLYLSNYHPKKVKLTQEELDYLLSKNTFNVCTNSNLYPLSGYQDGKLTGAISEVFQEISKALDIKFNAVKADNFALLSHKVKNNKCDFIDLINKDQNMFDNISTSRPINDLNMVLVGNKYSKNIHKSFDLEELNIYTSTLEHKNILNKHIKELNVIYEPDINKIKSELLKSTTNQYFIPIEVSKYFLSKNERYDFTTTYFFKDIKNGVSIGINNSDKTLVNIINKTLDNINKYYLSSLKDNYIFYATKNISKSEKDLSLSLEELRYLNDSKFNIYFDNWEPFTYKKGDIYKGYSLEYFNELFKTYNLDYEFVYSESYAKSLEKFKDDSSALILATTSSDDKSKYASFSIPYDRFEIALVTKTSENYTYDFNSLSGKKIAVGEFYSAYNLLKDKYPNIDFVFTKDTLEALNLVLDGKVYGAVDILPVMNNYITKYSMKDLKISGLSKELFNLQFMVNNENLEFVKILNRLITEFDNNKLYELRKSLFDVQKVQKVDMSRFYLILGILVTLVIILVISQIVLSNSKKQIEEERQKFKSLMENASDGIYILDLDGDVLDCNKTFAQSIGYSVNEIKDMNVSNWDCEIFKDDVRSKIIEIMNSNKTFSSINMKKDGKMFDVEINARAIVLNDIEYLYVSSRDLSDIKKAYEEIEYLNKQLNELNKSLELKIEKAIDDNTKQQAIIVHQNRLAQLGEMVSMIAHQWRQPISALSVWVSNIVLLVESENYTLDEIREIEDKVKEIVLYLSSTIDEFKNYYQTETKKTEFILDNTIKESLNILTSRISENQVNIVTNAIDEFKLNSYGNLLKQVVVAIVSNAIDALEKLDNKEIIINSMIDEKTVKIFIKDNGPGIPNDIQEKIFDPYFTTKSELNGTGLGLYMAKMIIVNSFKGNLDFETSSNGTTFKIEFPIKENV